MSKKYIVTLTAGERQHLTGLVSAGKRSALTITRARILLKADQADGGPAWDDARVAEARLIALACSAPPAGRARWTMKLLADKLVELEVFASVSDETVRRVLKKTSSSPT